MQKHQSVSSEPAEQGHVLHSSQPQATPLDSVQPQQREPLFLSKGTISILGTLTKDFINFSLILVFYICCWSVGSVAFMLDNMFNTRLFEYFIRFIEYLDTRGL